MSIKFVPSVAGKFSFVSKKDKKTIEVDVKSKGGILFFSHNKKSITVSENQDWIAPKVEQVKVAKATAPKVKKLTAKTAEVKRGRVANTGYRTLALSLYKLAKMDFKQFEIARCPKDAIPQGCVPYANENRKDTWIRTFMRATDDDIIVLKTL